MAITDWPPAERPREKLLLQGVQALSDAELLAIFLRTGVSGKTAVDLARELLKKFAGLQGLFSTDKATFCREHGLGLAKYVQLQATLEIARRYLHTSLQKGEILNNSLAAGQYLTYQLQGKQREVFACLFLDNQHRLIAFEELFWGSIRDITIHPREIVKRALVHNAAAVILAHNHPSGNVAPSVADKNLTKQLLASLAIVEVDVVDHLIVGNGKVFSFAQEGLLL